MKISRIFTRVFFLFLIIVSSSASAEPDYRIQAGDILEILTWNEPNFTREAAVREDGKISFPLIDDIQASGRVPIEVKKEIEEKLKTFISNPNVTVVIRSSIPQRFYILGEVTRTGEYELRKNMTILQAFAVAGGFTEWASKNEIILLRKQNGQDTIKRVEYKKIIKGQDIEQNVLLQPSDTIIVP